MKIEIKNILCAAAIISLTACSDNISLEPSQSADAVEGTTFFVMPYVQTSSRAGSIGGIDDIDPDFLLPYAPYHLSEGAFLDVLKFAVYEVKDDGTLEICPEYQKFSDPVGAAGITAGEGQNVIDMSNKSWPYQIRLLLDPTKNYKVAFWAQSGATSAYNSDNLDHIMVDYKKATNNDELRDAFSAVVDVAGKPDSYKVTLYRAVAQINIGVKGWDYEGAGYLEPNKVIYTKSQVRVSGLYNSFNAITQTVNPGFVTDDNGNPEKVTLEYSRIPAFTHLNDKQWANLSVFPYSNEEFLYINLPDTAGKYDDVILPYAGWDQYYNFRKYRRDDFTAGLRPETETFKYLSMCYLFAPDSAASNVNSLTFYINDEENKGMGEVLSLNNVPIQRNWRTNIICNDLFIANGQFHVYVVPTFCGDINNIGGKWKNEGQHFNEADGWIWGGGDPNDNFTFGPSDEERDGYDFPKDSTWVDDYYNTTYDLYADWIYKPSKENNYSSWGRIALVDSDGSTTDNENDSWRAEFVVTEDDLRDDATEVHFYVLKRKYNRIGAWYAPINPNSPYVSDDGSKIYICEALYIRPIEAYWFSLKPGKYAVTFAPGNSLTEKAPVMTISEIKN